MSTKVQKWGNSLAVRIPESVIEDVGFKAGREVVVRSERDTVVISPKPAKKKRRTLAELVARIRPVNLHGEIDWGKPVGREIW